MAISKYFKIFEFKNQECVICKKNIVKTKFTLEHVPIGDQLYIRCTNGFCVRKLASMVRCETSLGNDKIDKQNNSPFLQRFDGAKSNYKFLNKYCNNLRLSTLNC